MSVVTGLLVHDLSDGDCLWDPLAPIQELHRVSRPNNIGAYWAKRSDFGRYLSVLSRCVNGLTITT